MANPVLVEMVRGNLVESIHRGAFVVMRSDGTVLAEAGGLDRPVFPRSAYKMLQSLFLVESGAADAYGLGLEELSLACASHSSEPMHTDRVNAWLAKLGLADDDLECGPHAIRHEATRDALILAHKKPCRVHNNCSGKHTGFLTVAKHMGVPTRGYTDPNHPVQVEVTKRIAEVCQIDQAKLHPGTDGCGAPNLAMPLRNLALGFARLGDPSSLEEKTAMAALRLTEAVRAFPRLMSGTDRSCADLIEASKGRAVIKTGAEGVFAGFVADLKIGIALKIDDGATRASESSIASILAVLGVVDAKDPSVARWLNPPWMNTQNKAVGETRPTDILKINID